MAISMVQKTQLLGGLRIMVVDDEEDIRTLLAMFLRREGATVAQADSVIGAKEFLKTEAEFNIIVCDYKMPGGSGKELILWLKENHYSGGVVLITGHLDNASPEIANIQPDMLLQKPISFDQIVIKVIELHTNLTTRN